MTEYKYCPKCDEPKPLSDFNKRSDSKDGYYYVCKSCQRLAARDAYAKKNPPVAVVPVTERFLSKALEQGEHLIWIAGPQGKDYGLFWYEGRLQGAHRVSYKLFVGPLGPEDEINHLCRITRCVAPKCLEKGTHQTNMAYEKSDICTKGHDKNIVGRRADGACRQCCREYSRGW